jgi:hypothetical protein
MKTLITTFAAVAMLCAALPAAEDALQTNNDALRAAVEGKKGTADVKRLAVLVLSEARKQMGPMPADGDKENWDLHVKYAQQVSEYAEYALYSESVSAPAATAADLIGTLEANAPKSKYLTQDAYLIVANAAMSAQQTDRASAFAKKSLTAPKGAKPEQATGTAHYIIGVVAANKNDFATADKELRASLAGIKGNPAVEGPAYYYLGEAAYRVGRQNMDRTEADQGIKYMGQAAIISGQYQANASAELKRMKTEMGEK